MAEYWDLYDREKRKLNRLHRRGDEVPEGCYHLVAVVWVRDCDGRFLISRRHPDKPFPLFWETTGGSVTAGEDSLTGAVRELEEELGIRVQPEEMTYLNTIIREEYRTIYDVYQVVWNGKTGDLTLQETEVVDAQWINFDELCALDDAEKLVHTLRYFRKWFCRNAEKLITKQ